MEIINKLRTVRKNTLMKRWRIFARDHFGLVAEPNNEIGRRNAWCYGLSFLMHFMSNILYRRCAYLVRIWWKVQSKSHERNYKPHQQYSPPFFQKCRALTFSLTKLSLIFYIKCLLIPLKLFYMMVLFLWCFNPLKTYPLNFTSMYFLQITLIPLIYYNVKFAFLPIKLSDKRIV